MSGSSRSGRLSPLRVGLLILAVVLLAAAAGTGGYAETRAVRRHVNPTAAPTPSPVPPEVREATASPTPAPSSDAPEPSAAEVAAALRSAVAAPALGGRLLARVIDVQSGAVLYDHEGAQTAPPASTAKLLTAAAALTVYAPTERITTRVVAGGTPGTVVLVGAGDPTLTAAAAGQPGAYPDAARISDLAAQIKASGVAVRAIVVDDSLFTGPSVSPAWAPGDAPSSYALPITAVMVDGGRATPSAPVRSGTPDLAAGQALAVALGEPGLPVGRGTAPTSAGTVLASVQSPPMTTLVAQMLQNSDNVIAEMLARLVAVKTEKPASFTGAAAAISEVLGTAGVHVGSGMLDGSGLAAGDRLSPATLTDVLHLIATSNSGPAAVVTALPVAGWSGTLSDRYVSGATGSSAAGDVRAKTGTLTGVSSLAGFVHDSSGRLLAFALIADQVGPSVAATDRAESALDAVAATLAGCGCQS